ncbi:MAG: STAS domain-containing protein [Actinomycetota bacterium]
MASTELTVASRTRGRGNAKEATVAVVGEVDAANAKSFAHAIREAAGASRAVIVDLTAVPFMAFDGASALYAISAHFSREEIQWCVVGSPAVTRVLQLCDPEGLIPRADVPVLRGAEPA